jgi:1-acyl-sn-glycerol-3-phosphate acyltransferase
LSEPTTYVKVAVPAPIVARALPKALEARKRIRGLRGSVGFPWVAPTWPGGVQRPPVERTLGTDFNTDWARKTPARVARALVLDGVVKPAVGVVASPTIEAIDRLQGLEGPVIFVSNHSSHLDTFLVLTSIPERFRHRTVVAAAADYFFDRRLKGIASAMALAAIPIDRTAVSRKSLHLAEDLLRDDWNLIIFAEGGRTPDGWGQELEPGAAYLSTRCQVPIVPIHLEGVRRVWPKDGQLRRGSTTVTFGSPLRPTEGGALSDVRAMTAALERAIAVLADEQASDWWTARRRAAAGTTPSLRGPQASPWRRAWGLKSGERSGAGLPWPP